MPVRAFQSVLFPLLVGHPVDKKQDALGPAVLKPRGGSIFSPHNNLPSLSDD